MGWGAGGILGLVNVSDWNMDIQVSGGKLNDVYPCFQSGPYEETKRNLIKNKTSEGCSVQSYTSRKQAFAENTTNAIVLDISGNLDTEILLNLEKPAKMTITKSLRELAESNAVTFTGEFPSESIDLHQVVFSDNYSAQFEFTDTVNSEKGTDWYYVRVIQTNGQLAWSSPIWVGK